MIFPKLCTKIPIMLNDLHLIKEEIVQSAHQPINENSDPRPDSGQ